MSFFFGGTFFLHTLKLWKHTCCFQPVSQETMNGVLLHLVILGVLFPPLVSSQARECESQFAPLENIICGSNGPPEQQGYCNGTRGGKGFWVSSDQPIARNAPAGFAAEVSYFQRLFSIITSEVRAVRLENDYRPTCPEELGANENLSVIKRRWLRGALAHERRAGFLPSASNCFTEIKMSAERSKEYWDRMVSFGNYMTRTGEIMLEEARRGETPLFNLVLSCWKSIETSMVRAVETRAFLCELRHVTGFRSGSSRVFNVGAVLTNHPVNLSRPETKRHYLREKWTVVESSGKIIAKPLPSYKYGEIETQINSSTTLVWTWGGSPKVSSFMGIPIATNPAVEHVLQIAEKFEEAVFDSVAVSNLAILIFPAVFSLLPVSIFGVTENPVLIVGYAIATDILTVLPLAIKGIEMILFTQREHAGCVVWNVGVEIDTGLALSELWCAGCSHRPKFKPYGNWLLASAFAFSLAGFLLEYLAYKWVKRRFPIERKMESREWWKRKTWSETSCVECQCEYSSDLSFWTHHLPYQNSVRP